MPQEPLYPACCEWWETSKWVVPSSSSRKTSRPAPFVTSPRSSGCPGPGRNDADPETEHREHKILPIPRLYYQKSPPFWVSHLRGKNVGSISDLVELGCSQDSDVSVGPPAQIQFLAVSCDGGIGFKLPLYRNVQRFGKPKRVGYRVWRRRGSGCEQAWPWWAELLTSSEPQSQDLLTTPGSPSTPRGHKLANKQNQLSCSALYSACFK